MKTEIFGEDNQFGRSHIDRSVQCVLIELAEEHLDTGCLEVQIACQRVLGFKRIMPRMIELSIYPPAGQRMLELMGEGDTVVFREETTIEFGEIYGRK